MACGEGPPWPTTASRFGACLAQGAIYSDHIVHRQPFPGPGLAIRIIGEVDAEKLEVLKNADAIVREEVGVCNERLIEETGARDGERTYARPIILRAVESQDAMTADWARLPYDVLARVSSRVVAEVPSMNRVVYDIVSEAACNGGVGITAT